MKKNQVIITLLLAFFINFTFSQSPSQTIKGNVIDKQSQNTIPGVVISILNVDPIKKVLTDLDGNYKLENIVPGRYEIHAKYTGYKEIVISNVIVTTGKEVIVDISLEENISEIKEVDSDWIAHHLHKLN